VLFVNADGLLYVVIFELFSLKIIVKALVISVARLCIAEPRRFPRSAPALQMHHHACLFLLSQFPPCEACSVARKEEDQKQRYRWRVVQIKKATPGAEWLKSQG
jgi:hypothetical protein